MKVLIIGASGLVGSHVWREGVKRGHDVLGTFHDYQLDGLIHCDLMDMDSVECIIKEFKPDWIVHAAGWSWVDGCENDPQKAFKENCEQPSLLAEICSKRGIKFCYFSTSYVFDGTSGPYREGDIPNPINVYARSKWKAEQQIQDIYNGRALIPRIICVWGYEYQQKNFVYQVLRAVQSDKVIEIPCDQIGNPTWAGDIGYWLFELMENDMRGLWHLASGWDNCLREYWLIQILEGLRKCYRIDIEPFTYKLFSTCKGVQTARRPLNAGICTDKIQSRFTRKTKEPYSIDVLKLDRKVRI